MEFPTLELESAARELFGETPETRREKLEELRTRICEIQEDANFDCSDNNLIRYLRGKKFNVDKAHAAIFNTLKFNREHPAWTKDLTSQEFTSFSSVVKFLPHRDKDNRIILFLKASKLIKVFSSEYINDNPHGMIRFNIYLMNLISNNIDIQVYGLIMIGTFSDFTFWDAATLTTIAPVNERLGFFKYIQKCCAIRIGGMYMFEEPFYLRWVYNVIQTFLSEKLKNRFHLCNKNFNILTTVVDDVSFLPVCIGGKLRGEDLEGLVSVFV